MASISFITDLCLVTNRLPDVNVLETTISGTDANIWESSWRNKGKRLLGYMVNDSDEYVVTDIAVVPEDKDRGLDGYADLLITKDTREKGLKKHSLYYKRDSRKTAGKAIEQISLINQSKGELVPPLFTAVSYPVNELLVIFKVTEIPKVQDALPKLTIPQGGGQFRSNVPQSPAVPSGIDGIPFSINPKYDANKSNNDPVVIGISVISLDDLVRKYQYVFDTEDKVIAQSS